MNYFKFILFLGGMVTSYAQVHIADNNDQKLYNNAILQANTTASDIKGFKFPRKVLSGRIDYLTTETETDMVNSMLIFNNQKSNLSKGLYFWDSSRWNTLLDDSFIEKLSQVYLAVTKNSEKVYSFSTSTTDSSSGNIRIGMNYDSNIFTDLSNSITNLTNTFSIFNKENIIKLKTAGIIQLDNLENIPFNQVNKFNQASMGIGLFLKSPDEDDFKLIAYSVINANITSSCTKLPFNVFDYVYDLIPTGSSKEYVCKVAFDKRNFSLLNGENGEVKVSLGASDSPNCVNNIDNGSWESRNFLPEGASNIFLTTEIFEIIN